MKKRTDKRRKKNGGHWRRWRTGRVVSSLDAWRVVFLFDVQVSGRNTKARQNGGKSAAVELFCSLSLRRFVRAKEAATRDVCACVVRRDRVACVLFAFRRLSGTTTRTNSENAPERRKTAFVGVSCICVRCDVPDVCRVLSVSGVVCRRVAGVVR